MINEEGEGWRLAVDFSREVFIALIGGDYWAIELTESEWNSLVPLVSDLVEQHKKLQAQMMPEEDINLEIEREQWWGSLDGDSSCWSLRLIFDGQGNRRSFEIFWPTPAAQEVSKAMRNVWDSLQ